MFRSLLSALAATVLVVFCPLSQAANILTNGSFEDPVVPAASFQGFRVGQFIGTNNGTPWTYTFHNAGPFVDLRTYVIADNYPGYGLKTTPFSNQYYAFGEANQYTTVTTQGIVNPTLGHYELSFWQSDLNGGTGGALEVDVRTANNLQSLLGGRRSFTTAIGSDWVQHSIEFDIGFAGNFFLEIRSAPGHYGLIDNVQLSLATAPVPEPETYALMLAGLGVMGWVQRRRKSQNAALS